MVRCGLWHYCLTRAALSQAQQVRHAPYIKSLCYLEMLMICVNPATHTIDMRDPIEGHRPPCIGRRRHDGFAIQPRHLLLGANITQSKIPTPQLI